MVLTFNIIAQEEPRGGLDSGLLGNNFIGHDVYF